MTQTTEAAQASRIRQKLMLLKQNISKVIRGKDATIDQVLICLAAGGHVLLEDLPGLGKTTLAYCLARSIDCSFRRIQFTSDLLPSDVIGVAIYDERTREFVLKLGPIFANIVLADEINRATPKTQSALLEVMDRGKVSMDGETHVVPPPFMVLATQNPVDFEGTFPLPQSQMDRFMMRLRMGYPEPAYEREILNRDASFDSYDTISIQPVVSAEDIREITSHVTKVFVESSLVDYMLKLVAATRTEAEFTSGISTRGAISLKKAAQARALLEGRHFVTPADIAQVYGPVFIHRLSLVRHIADPLEERRVVMTLLQRIIDSIEQPT